ncbi:membrane protein [Microbacterium phage Pumpernickel]|uniref:Membrane protein n=1 Tax=Microbacterium phage Pumpernickel TaxID=2885983 RepID=A0AAE8Y7D5_9CAUD|nr:hypothetical protein QEH42_gp027 [Microbacterium phage Pumpernickel]YP_010755318.1 membrane protein [Microbacterium phage Pumpernickel]UDL15818.1 hypothetical protein SEA_PUMPERNICKEL_27 [Microbacterium phage Pumpernickel]UDL16078.1 membrane protein [Microbacterium phage Pumpernickel]
MNSNQPRKVFKPRWADIATCVFVSAVVLIGVTVFLNLIPA